MAAARKPRTTKPEGEQPEGEQPEGEQPEGEQPEGEQPEGEQPEGEQPEGAVTPEGYMWVTRRKSVQLGGPNPQWAKPSLIDVKSFAELEPQGWRAADGPDATGPSVK